MPTKMSRRKFGKVAIGGAAAVFGAAMIGRYGDRGQPGVKMSAVEFMNHANRMSTTYGAYPTTYIPIGQRRPNTDGSCVHLATANIFLSMGRPDLAATWLNSYRGGEYSSRHIRRMTADGMYFAVETDGDPRFVDYFAGNTGEASQRVMGCSYRTRHVMNLLDIDPPNVQNPRAYILNNQRKSGSWAWDSPIAAEVPRRTFLSSWDSYGGWAFTVIGTKMIGTITPNPPYPVLVR